jgi:phosphohistidine phosphatase
MAMIRHLYLVRHAKTVDLTNHQSDIDRELTPQGKADAEKIGAMLRLKQIKFDLMYCSPAKRTHKTAQLILHSSAMPIEILHIEPVLYQASSPDFLSLISKTSSTYQQVAIVGHNPAISAFANNLLTSGVGGFTPGTVAAIEFYTPWNEIEPGAGQLNFIHSPSIL